jgi:hypothetical protein
LLALLRQVVARSAATRRGGPWTLSSFIVHAVEEQLKKMASPLPPAYHRDSSTF